MSVLPRMADSIVAQAVSQLLEEQPDMEVTVEVQPRRYLERWVASRKFDIGLGALPAYHSAVQTEQIYSVPVVAVLHPEHKLASRSSLRVKELSQERLIMMPPNTLLGQQMVDILDSAGVIPNSTILASEALLCCRFVAQGLGVSITDAMLSKTFAPSVKIVPIRPQIYGFWFALPTWGQAHERNPEIHRNS